MSSRGRGAKRAGDHYERELAKLLGARRQLGAGRQDDIGDIHHNGWAIQVCYRATITSAVASFPAKWADVVEQSVRSGLRPALALRWPRAPWRVVVSFDDGAVGGEGVRSALLASDDRFCYLPDYSLVRFTDLSVLMAAPYE
jgi:hypothetical protein